MLKIMPTLEVLQHRARLYARLRHHFAAQQYLELDLPLFGAVCATQSSDTTPILRVCQDHRIEEWDQALIAVMTHYQVAVYQFGHTFAVAQHKTHREESVLRWAAPHGGIEMLKTDMAAVLGVLFEQSIEPISCRYQDAMARRLDLDVDQATCAQLKAASRRLGLSVDHGENQHAWQQQIFYQFVEPTIGLNDVMYVSDCPPFAGQPSAELLVYIEGLVVGALSVVAAQPIATIMLDRILMIMEGTRRLARVQWCD
jgi:elongation factor P--beta-lysine ligase